MYEDQLNGVSSIRSIEKRQIKLKINKPYKNFSLYIRHVH